MYDIIPIPFFPPPTQLRSQNSFPDWEFSLPISVSEVIGYVENIELFLSLEIRPTVIFSVIRPTVFSNYYLVNCFSTFSQRLEDRGSIFPNSYILKR